MTHAATLSAITLACAVHGAANAQRVDARIQEVRYDPQAVVTVNVKRGVVTDLEFEPGETITDVASGLGGDCNKPDTSWCVATQLGARHVFVKPKSNAAAPNNLAVVTDRRSYSFRLVVLPDQDTREPVYRVVMSTPRPEPAIAPPRPLGPIGPSPAELIRMRLGAAPVPANGNYSIAEGKLSEDIVPTLVYDDGRFTYLRFPNNREVPAVFHVQQDGRETMVNARMENDLLVVDRVSRQLMLRAGSAVIGVFNEAFDLDGVPPSKGTTAPGVERTLRSAPISDTLPRHESGGPT